MKKIMTILFMLLSINLVAKELEAQKYHSRGEVTVTAACPAFPVLEMIQAFLDNDLEKAKSYGTENYTKYVKYSTSGWDAAVKEFKDDWDKKEPIRFRFDPDEKKAGDSIVEVLYHKGDRTFRNKYRIRQIDGVYKIVPFQ